MTDIYINDKYTGTATDPRDFVKQLRTERRRGAYTLEHTFFYNEDFDEIHLDTTRGRARRPLIVVENGKPKLTDQHLHDLKKGEIKWEKLVKENIIEYLDAAEEENCLIAFNDQDLTNDHTHIEIGPIVILALVTSLVP